MNRNQAIALLFNFLLSNVIIVSSNVLSRLYLVNRSFKILNIWTMSSFYLFFVNLSYV